MWGRDSETGTYDLPVHNYVYTTRKVGNAWTKFRHIWNRERQDFDVESLGSTASVKQAKAELVQQANIDILARHEAGTWAKDAGFELLPEQVAKLRQSVTA